MHYYTWLATKEPITEDNYWDYMEKYYYDNNKITFVDETEEVIAAYNSEEKRKVRRTLTNFEFIYENKWDKDIYNWALKDYVKQGNWSINRFYNLCCNLPINKNVLTAEEVNLFDLITKKYSLNDPLSLTFKIEQSKDEYLKDFIIIKKLVKAINKQCPIIELTMKEIYPTIEAYVEDFYGCVVETINNETRYGFWVNPDSLFDWCVIGGKWKDCLESLSLSKGVDSCIKSDLNLPLMNIRRTEYLTKEFNRDKELQACYKDLDEYLQIWNTFYPNTFIIDTGKYHEKWKHLQLLSYDKRKEENRSSRIELLKDDKQDQIKHNQIMQELFDKLPDNYYITIIDMHN